MQFMWKCLEFCPYVEYDLNRAQEEMKELAIGRNTADCGSMRYLRIVQFGLPDPCQSIRFAEPATGRNGCPRHSRAGHAELR